MDKQISDLHDEIDKVLANINNLKAEIREKTSEYETNIELLKATLEAGAEQSEKDIEAQQKNFDAEIAKLREDQEKELKKMALDATARSDDFTRKHNAVIRSAKEAELADLRQQLETARVRKNEAKFNAMATAKEERMEKQQKVTELEAKIESLRGEISDVEAARKEEIKQAKLRLEECKELYEQRDRNQEEMVAKYREEIKKREEQYAEHIQIVKKQTEKEKEKLNNELKMANDKVASLQQLFMKLEKKNHQQQQTAQMDIEMLQETIAKMKQRYEEQLMEAKTQVVKLHDAQNRSVVLEQEIDSLKTQISQLRADNSEMKRESQRIDTQLYSSRLSKSYSKRRSFL